MVKQGWHGERRRHADAARGRRSGWKKIRIWNRGNGMTFDKIGELGATSIEVYKTNNMNPPWRTTYHAGGSFITDRLSKSKKAAITIAKEWMIERPSR